MTDLETITISLDARPHSVPAASTLSALVSSLDHQPDKVSTAVNGLFVPRAKRDVCVLADGDAVLFFQPIVGG